MHGIMKLYIQYLNIVELGYFSLNIVHRVDDSQ